MEDGVAEFWKEYFEISRRKDLERASRLPIRYHEFIEPLANWFAEQQECSIRDLRDRCERAIRDCPTTAYVRRDEDRGFGPQPNVFALELDSSRDFWAYFTVEEHAVVIRGFGRESPPEPHDEWAFGWYFCETEWNWPDDWDYHQNESEDY